MLTTTNHYTILQTDPVMRMLLRGRRMTGDEANHLEQILSEYSPVMAKCVSIQLSIYLFSAEKQMLWSHIRKLYDKIRKMWRAC